MNRELFIITLVVAATSFAMTGVLTWNFDKDRSGGFNAPADNAFAYRTGAAGVCRNITISNLTATCPKAAGLILGLPESCISNVVLENVKISAAKPFSISNAKGVELKNVSVTVPTGESFKLENAEVAGLPMHMGLIRNHYVGRTFIEPHQ